MNLPGLEAALRRQGNPGGPEPPWAKHPSERSFGLVGLHVRSSVCSAVPSGEPQVREAPAAHVVVFASMPEFSSRHLTSSGDAGCGRRHCLHHWSKLWRDSRAAQKKNDCGLAA